MPITDEMIDRAAERFNGLDIRTLIDEEPMSDFTKVLFETGTIKSGALGGLFVMLWDLWGKPWMEYQDRNWESGKETSAFLTKLADEEPELVRYIVACAIPEPNPIATTKTVMDFLIILENARRRGATS